MLTSQDRQTNILKTACATVTTLSYMAMDRE
jgi:hypothetical protein